MNELAASNRLTHLETARGIASIIVVLHHFLLGFLPLLKQSAMQGGIGKTPLYIFVNGTGAVAFFFLLSGYVLTLKFYQRFSASELISAMLKRLPRLWLPAGLSIMVGASVYIYLPEPHAYAARLTDSQWLADFAGADHENLNPSFIDAVIRSLLVFMWPGYEQYNSSLWTMTWEFYGSFLVFFIVLVCNYLNFKNNVVIFLVHLAAFVICASTAAFNNFLPFVVGSLIAFFHCKYPKIFRVSPLVAIVLVLMAIVGYSFNNWYALIVASTAAMLLLLCIPSLKIKLGGPYGQLLGRLSFPLYLVHVPVILSVTCASYNAMIDYGATRFVVVIISLIITLIFSFVAAIPFILLEKIWVPALNRWTKIFVQIILSTMSDKKENTY